MRISIYELSNRYVYPAVRRRLVEILYYEMKLNQLEIAKLLKISQSAVSRYVVRLAERIVQEKPGEYTLHFELGRIVLKILAKGYVCSFHTKIDRAIDPKKCRICLDLFKPYI